jgi:hypothetical protein
MSRRLDVASTAAIDAWRIVVGGTLHGDGGDLFCPALGDQHLRKRVLEIDDLPNAHIAQIDAIQCGRKFFGQTDIHGMAANLSKNLANS